jgi:hypothetical protein
MNMMLGFTVADVVLASGEFEISVCAASSGSLSRQAVSAIAMTLRERPGAGGRGAAHGAVVINGRLGGDCVFMGRLRSESVLLEVLAKILEARWAVFRMGVCRQYMIDWT